MSRAVKLKELLERGKTQNRQKDELDMKWSPNNVRMVVLTQTMAWVQHYTSNTSNKSVWDSVQFDKPEADEKSALSVLFGKSGGITYSCLEAVIFLVSPDYYTGSWKADAGQYYNALRASESELQESFPRLRNYLSFKCASQDQKQMVLSRLKASPDITKEKEVMDILMYANSLQDMHKDTWWQAGLYDAKIPDAKKRVLRPWIYALDKLPDEDNKNAGPIYHALYRIGKPYIDAIEEKKKEELEEKAKQKATDRNSKTIEKDKELALKNADKYAGLSAVLMQAQRAKFDVVSRRILMANTLHTKLHKSQEDIVRYMDTSIMAYDIGSAVWKRFGDSKESWANRLARMQSQQVYNTFSGISQYQGIAEMMKGFLRYYYGSSFQLTSDGRVVPNKLKCCFVKEEKADKSGEIQKLQYYVDGVKKNVFPSMSEVAVEDTMYMSVSEYFKIFDTMLYTELILAYISFIKLIPYWYQSIDNYLNEAMCVLLATKFGFDTYDNPLIRYDKQMKEIMNPYVSIVPDWDKKFTEMPCTKWFEGTCHFKTAAEYGEHIQGVYKAVNYLINNIME